MGSVATTELDSHSFIVMSTSSAVMPRCAIQRRAWGSMVMRRLVSGKDGYGIVSTRIIPKRTMPRARELRGGFLQLARADVISDRQPVHIEPPLMRLQQRGDAALQAGEARGAISSRPPPRLRATPAM